MHDKEQYSKLVCLFLAEQLRVKKISLQRAADIAQKVISNLNLIDSEADFLQLIKELSKDFEELFTLEEKIFFWMQINQRRSLETAVRGFAIEIIPQNPKLALEIMLEALREGVGMEDLKQKFPGFLDYLEANRGSNG